MSKVDDLRRMVLHAAGRLAEEDPWSAMVGDALTKSEVYYQRQALAKARSLVLAMQLAESTLRFVASCITDDGADDER